MRLVACTNRLAPPSVCTKEAKLPSKIVVIPVTVPRLCYSLGANEMIRYDVYTKDRWIERTWCGQPTPNNLYGRVPARRRSTEDVSSDEEA